MRLKQNKNYTLTVNSVLIIVAILLIYQCGPRSGTHEEDVDSSEDIKTKEPQFICGNAIQKSNNIERANKTFGLKGDGYNGKKLFKQNCAACHSLNDQRLIGSGLNGIINRVPKPEIEQLKKYIMNSEKVYKSGDSYATMHHEKSSGLVMTNFDEYLTDEDVADILVYVLGNTKQFYQLKL